MIILAPAIERARQALDLTYGEIATSISANESTLHRWRSGESRPSRGFRLRILRLAELVDALERAFPEPERARAWLHAPHASLWGQAPLALLRQGRPDLVLGVLLASEPAATPIRADGSEDVC